jgi:hypothetical protein
MRYFLILLFSLFASSAFAQPDWGVYPDGSTLYFYSNTVGANGAPATPAAEAVAVYKDGSATELTTGSSIDDDWDGVVGFNQIAIDTTQSGFDTGSTYTVVYTAGTSDSVSLTGRIIGSFRLGVVPSNVLQWNTVAIATPDAAGYPKVTIKDGTGTGEIDTTSGGIAHVILSDTITTYTGDTVQTGDSYARIGATGSGLTSLASQSSVTTVSGYVDDIGVAGAGLTAVPWNASWDAEVESEVADALNVAIPGSPIANSINERIQTIDNAYTATRAGYLDNINNSALSTTVAQTGDSFVIVNNGTFGNSALNTAIGTRLATSGYTVPPTTTEIWNFGTRILTAGTNIALAKGVGVTGFNDIAATDVWSVTTRRLSDGTNIALAKGTGVTGFNDITVANVWGAATSGLSTSGSVGKLIVDNVDAKISEAGGGGADPTILFDGLPNAITSQTQIDIGIPAAGHDDSFNGAMVILFDDEFQTPHIRWVKACNDGTITLNSAPTGMTITTSTRIVVVASPGQLDKILKDVNSR